MQSMFVDMDLRFIHFASVPGPVPGSTSSFTFSHSITTTGPHTAFATPRRFSGSLAALVHNYPGIGARGQIRLRANSVHHAR